MEHCSAVMLPSLFLAINPALYYSIVVSLIAAFTSMIIADH